MPGDPHNVRPAALKKRRPWVAVARWLRAPKVIVGELAGISVAGVLGAVFPQLGTATAGEVARWRASGPAASWAIDWLSLDHVFRSPWFLALTLLAVTSLALVVRDQLRRLRQAWSRTLAKAHFETAPLRAEFVRLAAGPAKSQAASQSLKIWTENRLGLAGSPLFHLGLLCVILAGAWRALFATEAVVDLVQGETLPPSSASWATQWPGLLARPFQLDVPLTLNQIQPAHYTSGSLRNLKVELSLGGSGGGRKVELAVNRDFQGPGGRLFLDSHFGPAALVEWRPTAQAPSREAVLLASQGKSGFEGDATAGPGGLRAYLRATTDSAGGLTGQLEARIMRGKALVSAGLLTTDEPLALAGGGELVLRGLPWWARLRGSRDSALWLAYLGFVMVMGGAALMFTMVKVDFCICSIPAGHGEWVFIAVKPLRFAPLFQERFQQLLREQGAPASAMGSVPGSDPAAARLIPETRPDSAGNQPSAPFPLAIQALLLASALAQTSCRESSLDQARQLVERYNQVVSEAYRRGDVKLADPVVGPNEGKKLTGLIGVRLDMGITLDSQLLSLEVTGVEQAPGEMKVRTRERWRYRDLKIGTGQQVGEESLDHYEMLYLFKKTGPEWLVDGIQFTAEPQVGRKTTTWAADVRTLHGVTPNAPKEETKQP